MRQYYSGFVALFLIISGCSAAQNNSNIREPAVRGQFYPIDKKECLKELNSYFKRVEDITPDNSTLALILPHAGWVFSGEVIAAGIKKLNPEKKYETIFLIGASHNFLVEKPSVWKGKSFKTPLGEVPINLEITESLIKSGVFIDNKSIHIPEHSLEVILPFLQYHLKKSFTIVPIILDSRNLNDSYKASEILKDYLKDSNLFIISSDFSHYPSWEDAIKVDADTLKAILSNNPETLIKSINESMKKNIPGLQTCACGFTAIECLLFMTSKRNDINIKSVKYMNSGDTGIGSKDRVVGYHAIAFLNRSMEGSMKQQEEDFHLNEKEKEDLLKLARKTIEQYIGSQTLFEPKEEDFSENCKKKCGAFVTLHKKGHLRGCIGTFSADKPLFLVIRDMAIASATQDPRFNPVSLSEIKDLDIEISVLSPMKKISDISEIKLGKHGIYIKKGFRAGTFLPQVATETGWTLEEFLGHCSADKAGLGWDEWRTADIYIYTAEVFGEKK